MINYVNYKGYQVYPNGEIYRNGKLVKWTYSYSRSGVKYYKVRLYKKGKRKSYYVHRLVAWCFIGEVNGMEVNHKDRDPSNNRLENLEIVTASENQKHWRNK